VFSSQEVNIISFVLRELDLAAMLPAATEINPRKATRSQLAAPEIW
jgi:hypothetical protein